MTVWPRVRRKHLLDDAQEDGWECVTRQQCGPRRDARIQWALWRAPYVVLHHNRARPCFHVLRNAALIKWNAYLWSHCTGCTRYTGVRGARERGGKSGERERRGEKASAAAPSTCLAAPSGVTNLNGTLCAPIASACLLILTPHDFYRRRCRMLWCPPLITIAVKFGRGWAGFFSISRRICKKNFGNLVSLFFFSLSKATREVKLDEMHYCYVNEIWG